MGTYFPLLATLIALLLGLAVGKGWERYKLRDGRWIDRRRLRAWEAEWRASGPQWSGHRR